MTAASTRSHPKLRPDDVFFSGMAAIALVAVFVGFARTYFLAGVFWAPLANPLLHIHGAAFTLWIVLLITQISLAAARRVDLHRRLGQFGFALAAIMIVLGVLAASDGLARHGANPGTDSIEDVRSFYAVPMSAMLMFSTFIYLGYRNRSRPVVHKRLMLFATLSLLDAAFDRWPVFDPYPLPLVHLVTGVPLVLLAMGYDWWSTGRVQRVTLLSAVFLIVVQQSRQFLGGTVPWQHFAAWVQLHMPALS
jgi:hypothetical protein